MDVKRHGEAKIVPHLEWKLSAKETKTGVIWVQDVEVISEYGKLHCQTELGTERPTARQDVQSLDAALKKIASAIFKVLSEHGGGYNRIDGAIESKEYYISEISKLFDDYIDRAKEMLCQKESKNIQ